jgi:hypothetical protein
MMAAGDNDTQITELENKPTVAELERKLLSSGLYESARTMGVSPARLDQIRCRYDIDLVPDRPIYVEPQPRTLDNWLGERGLSWTWIAFFMGPFYFFMSRSYFPAFGFLFVVAFVEWLIPYELTKMTSILQFVLGIACAIAARPLAESRLRSREKDLRERLEGLGYTGALLEMELRDRERGGTWLSVFVTFGLLALYFVTFLTYIYIFDSLSVVF